MQISAQPVQRRAIVYGVELSRYSSKAILQGKESGRHIKKGPSDNDHNYLKLHPKFCKPSIKLPSICLPLNSDEPSPNKNSSRRKQVSERPRFKTDGCSHDPLIIGVESSPFSFVASLPKHKQQNSYQFLPQFVKERQRLYKQDQFIGIFPHRPEKNRGRRKVVNFYVKDLSDQKSSRRSRTKNNISNFLSKISSRAQIYQKSHLQEGSNTKEVRYAQQIIQPETHRRLRLEQVRTNDIKPWEIEDKEDLAFS